ncbi:MAG: dNTP triphosphohydrolase, partial [Geminicoccaceae bacterium]|nr:dNTP triphosphohydrolase [Geminicoccaceae bacterium]
LTHSLEVAQIARTIARALHVDEDLAETIALAHDLGHSPFGHAGEAALNEAARDAGGFDHNLQSFRVLTRLEQRYAGFDGLNLSVETLEGVIKHNGPLPRPWPGPIADHPQADLMHLELFAPLEAQIAGIADDVAYCSHDLDDGLRASFFALDDLLGLPVFGEMVGSVLARYPDVRRERLIHESIRRIIDSLVSDLIVTARGRIAGHDPQSPMDIRTAGRPLIAFCDEYRDAVDVLRSFLHGRMYRHYKVCRMALKATRLVRGLYEVLVDDPRCLPDRWRDAAGAPRSEAAQAAVRDYIAGMTDRYAIEEHERLFDMTSWHP